MSVHFENLRFREGTPAQLTPNEGGFCFLGYQSGDLIVTNALPDGSDLVVTLKDIRVRIHVDGTASISMPSREFETAKGETRRSMIFWIEGPTRDFLVKEIFAQRVVQRAYERALAQVDAEKELPAS